MQGASRWFCKIYCGKAVIVGLIQIKTPPDSGEGEPELNGANGRRRKSQKNQTMQSGSSAWSCVSSSSQESE